MTPSQTIWKGVCIFMLLCWETIYAALSTEAEEYDTFGFTTVHRTPYPHFIMFHAPWCGPCKDVMPTWNKFAGENHKKRRMKIGKVDCIENTPLCAAEKIKAYPTFRLYYKHKKFTFRESRSIIEFNRFVNKNIPNLPDNQIPETGDSGHHSNKKSKTSSRNTNYHGGNVVVLTGENFDAETENGLTFVDFFAPWCSHCRKLEPIWKQLAERFAYDDRIKIAKVDCTADPELCQRKSINAYPSLHLYKDGNFISEFNFERSLNGLSDFVNKAIADGEEETISIDPETDLPPIDPPPLLNKPTPLKTDVKWFDRMDILDNVFHQPLCVYLHDPTKSNSVEKLSVFEEFGKKLEDSLASGVDAVVFDCTRDKAFCKKFQVGDSDDSPIIVYFKTTLDDYVIFDQSKGVTVDNLLQFLENHLTDKDEL